MSAKHKPAKHKAPAHHEHEGHSHPAHQEHKTPAHHAHKSAPSGGNDSLKNAAIVVLALALVAVLIWAFTGGNDGGTTIPEDKRGTATGSTQVAAAGGQVMDKATQAAMIALADDDPFIGAEDAPVVIVEFSDFECPYCSRFWQQTLPSIKENFVETGVVKFVYRDLALSFHANAQKAAEAAQCAHEQGKFWEYHDVLFANTRALDQNSLKKYAADLGLDIAQFDECLTSGKYADEVIEDGQAANANGITGTPGFIINGQKISGAQPYDKFEQAICALVPDSEPCKNIEPPVEVEVIVLKDAKCTACSTAGIEATTKDLFPGAIFRYVDAGSGEGKDLVEKYDLVFAPAYFFSDSVAETKTWATRADMAGFFDKLDEGYRLKDSATGADWYLDEEKREEAMAELKEQLDLDLSDGKPQVDFFVMSYCPYGNQAEELLRPVFDQLKGQAIFNPRYVVYGQGSGCYTDTDGTQLCSLHGAVELNQNIRELCVLDEYGEEAWFDFAIAMNSECDGTNADTCWTGVAEDLGYDTDAVETCFDENKVEYARRDYDLGQALGVSGSPTLFFEGEQYNGARSSNAYLAALCAGFDEPPAACDAVVEETVAAPAAGNC